MKQQSWWDLLSAVPGGHEMKVGDSSQVKVLVAGASGFAKVRHHTCHE